MLLKSLRSCRGVQKPSHLSAKAYLPALRGTSLNFRAGYGIGIGSCSGTNSRQFSTTKIGLLPFKIYQKSPYWRALQYIPQPIKSFGSIVLGTALTLLLAPGLILLLGPPLIVGSLFVWRRMRQLKAQLHDKRWQDMASYHLVPRNGQNPSHVPYAARSRIFDAIVENERGLGEIFPSPMDQDYTFTDLESLSQDFKADFGGINTAMTIEQYGMITGGKRVATVFLVERGDKMRIEIKPKRGGEVVVLDGQSHSEIIDVKKK